MEKRRLGTRRRRGRARAPQKSRGLGRLEQWATRCLGSGWPLGFLNFFWFIYVFR